MTDQRIVESVKNELIALLEKRLKAFQKAAEKTNSGLDASGLMNRAVECREQINALKTRPADTGPEPLWEDSRTGLLEMWKNPMISKNDRLEIADGAIAWRDDVIKTLSKNYDEPVDCWVWMSNDWTFGGRGRVKFKGDRWVVIQPETPGGKEVVYAISEIMFEDPYIKFRASGS